MEEKEFVKCLLVLKPSEGSSLPGSEKPGPKSTTSTTKENFPSEPRRERERNESEGSAV
jgi:hypothetical protein